MDMPDRPRVSVFFGRPVMTQRAQSYSARNRPKIVQKKDKLNVSAMYTMLGFNQPNLLVLNASNRLNNVVAEFFEWHDRGYHANQSEP